MAITNKDLVKKIEAFEESLRSQINGVSRVVVEAKAEVKDLKPKVDELLLWKSNIAYAESLEDKKLTRQISNNPNKVIINKLLMYLGWLIAIIAALLKVEL